VPEVAIITGRNHQPVPARGRCDVTVFDGHAMADSIKHTLLIGPHLRN